MDPEVSQADVAPVSRQARDTARTPTTDESLIEPPSRRGARVLD